MHICSVKNLVKLENDRVLSPDWLFIHNVCDFFVCRQVERILIFAFSVGKLFYLHRIIQRIELIGESIPICPIFFKDSNIIVYSEITIRMQTLWIRGSNGLQIIYSDISWRISVRICLFYNLVHIFCCILDLEWWRLSSIATSFQQDVSK